jgi:hypothetical protein
MGYVKMPRREAFDLCRRCIVNDMLNAQRIIRMLLVVHR